MSSHIIFAIPKGRLLSEALPLLEKVGLAPEAAFHKPDSRALIFATEQQSIRLIRVRAFDVATFVAHGAAAMGIVGSDVIEEFRYSELYAPVDLNIGHCRLALAGPPGSGLPDIGTSHLRIATKYPTLTRAWCEKRAIQAEPIHLNGAMEIAPKLGLAPYIVDLVSSGQTLLQNGLVEQAVVAPVSARLIVNRAAFKLCGDVLQPLIECFRAAVADTAGVASMPNVDDGIGESELIGAHNAKLFA